MDMHAYVLSLGKSFGEGRCMLKNGIDQDKLNLFVTICSLGAEVKSSV
jgi:hypothetical protein